jgi:hypothetical protein
MTDLLTRSWGRHIWTLAVAVLFFAPAAVAQNDSLVLASGIAAANGFLKFEFNVSGR